MSFWTEQRPMTGLQTYDTEKLACRYCRHAIKGHIGWGECKKYKDKPMDVLFDNANCPSFTRGEDLWPYDIEHPLNSPLNK